MTRTVEVNILGRFFYFLCAKNTSVIMGEKPKYFILKEIKKMLFEKFKVHFEQVSYRRKKVKCKIEIEKISGEIMDLVDSIPNFDKDRKMELYRKIEQLEEKFGEFTVYEYKLRKINRSFN